VYDAKGTAEQTTTAAKRQVADLTKQRDAITSQLGQLREMLHGLIGGGGAAPANVPVQATAKEALAVVEDIEESVEFEPDTTPSNNGTSAKG
jgi:hypothetical protein